MANNKQKILFALFNLILLLSFCLPVLAANDGYILLEPSVVNQQGGSNTTMNLKDYLEQAYYIFLVVIVISAVAMFVWGGLIYMTTDLPGGKKNGKDKITNAVLGLLLAASSYLILYILGGTTFLQPFSLVAPPPATPPPAVAPAPVAPPAPAPAPITPPSASGDGQGEAEGEATPANTTPAVPGATDSEIAALLGHPDPNRNLPAWWKTTPDNPTEEQRYETGLSNYENSIKNGFFSDGMNTATIARVEQMAINKGIITAADLGKAELEYKVSHGIPTNVTVNKTPLNLTDSDYTADELKYLHMTGI